MCIIVVRKKKRKLGEKMPKDQNESSSSSTEKSSASTTSHNAKRSSRIQKALQEASDQKIKIEDKNGQRRMDMLRSHLNPDTSQRQQEKSSPTSSPLKSSSEKAVKSNNAPQKSQIVFPAEELSAYLSPFSPKENKAREKVVQAMRDRPDLFHPYDIDLSRIEQLDLNYERVSIIFELK